MVALEGVVQRVILGAQVLPAAPLPDQRAAAVDLLDHIAIDHPACGLAAGDTALDALRKCCRQWLDGGVEQVAVGQPLGIVVVRQDSPIRAARELDGHTLAFPAPNAFGASLLTRAQLVEVERIRITPVYARTHTNAYRHTLAGLSTATGGLRATLAREPAEVQAGLRVLMETPGAAPHPLSVHPRVPKALHARLQQAWLQLAQQPELRPSFKAIPMPQPVLADQARDYEPLRRLRLERYAQ